MNRIQSGGKLANCESDAMAQILGEMRKAVLDPLGNPVSSVGNQ